MALGESVTVRMHPGVCGFISDAVYDGRLEPEAGNVKRTLVLDASAHPLLKPSGIVHAAIAHKGCAQGSPEEVALVARVYQSALQQRDTDRAGAEHAMTPDNVLVVAPYNAPEQMASGT